MAGVVLEAKEANLKARIEELVAQIKKLLGGAEQKKLKALVDDLVEPCHELHMALAARSLEPRFRKFFLENRRMPPRDPEFYRHLHSAERLLDFVQDTGANDDPVDQTLGHEFAFRVFARRWGHDDNYHFKRTPQGWSVEHVSAAGACNKKGQPHLYELFTHDSVNYPADLGGYLEWLWNLAEEDGLSHEDVQRELDRLAEWVSICERASPGGIFESFK
ncbi:MULTISPECIES: hypothetical protein [Sorangium]|uniref:hypothetical protein n=1 Tax=Sorangium TaxID=39643 RepID=UPI003D9C0A19